jgi:hypothetical protein
MLKALSTTLVLSSLAFACTACSDNGSEVWPAYQDGYAAGQDYTGPTNKTRDHCWDLANEKYGETESPEWFAFSGGCGEGANELPMQSQEAIEGAYADVQSD